MMRFKAEVSAGRQLPSVQVWSWYSHYHWGVGLRQHGPPSHHAPGPSVIEPTIYYNLGAGMVQSPSTSRAGWHWPPEEVGQVLGGLSQTAPCALAGLEGERRHREQTLMESFKSTLRAVRFLSLGDRKRSACGFSLRGHVRNGCLLLITWRQGLLSVLTQEGGRVWMLMALWASTCTNGQQTGDLGLRNLTPPSRLIRASVWALGNTSLLFC